MERYNYVHSWIIQIEEDSLLNIVFTCESYKKVDMIKMFGCNF